MPQQPVTIHKFGGSSLASSASFKTVKRILGNTNSVIVVSAIKGVTALLRDLLRLAKLDQDYAPILERIKQAHQTLIDDLLGKKQAQLLAELEHDWENISNILRAIHLVKGYSRQAHDLILGYGEQWSAKILSHYLAAECEVNYLDASKVLFVKSKQGKTYVDWEKSQAALDTFLNTANYQHLIITGFIAADAEGGRTILGHNGSDFSAAIFAKLFSAQSLTIWTDVDGIYSADPNKVQSAFVIQQMSYEEAFELAYFGACVIHPDAIAPAMASNIPITIKNSFNPEAQGTCISAQAEPTTHAIQGLTSIDHIALINIEGAGMIGIPGIAARVFTALQHYNISVILISQASSEHSICFAVTIEEADLALKVLDEHFQFEISKQQIKPPRADKECAIVAVVGNGMVGAKGIASRFCYTLALANINIRAIAQGSSERNISLVINREQVGKALRSAHAGFYLSKKTISIGLIGPGIVGSALLQQIHKAQQQLRDSHNIDLCVRGIMQSKQMLLIKKDIDLQHWQKQMKQQGQASNVACFVDHILADDMPHAAIIDCTASQDIADQYLDFLDKGVHIITPNKRANSGNLNYYQQLKQKVIEKNRFYFYETTVCAGLPIIKTLQDIIQTGDDVISIEGIVSGTLSYIFNELSQGKSFASIIKNAKQLGYTEPDPRDDLTGMDVARKIVCLARELGLAVNLDDVKVESLVPNELQSCTAAEFLEQLPDHDQVIMDRLKKIAGKDRKLGYVGSIKKNGHIEIGIQAFSPDHPFAKLTGTDNMLIFYTQRYSEQPLVIQGPGAGAEVTAAGVFADLLRLSSSLSG